ncbi:unnamed protein product [Brassica rapa subsp. trilocularis]
MALADVVAISDGLFRRASSSSWDMFCIWFTIWFESYTNLVLLRL